MQGSQANDKRHLSARSASRWLQYPTDLFGAFVAGCVEIVRKLTKDEEVTDAFKCSLSLVFRMVRAAWEASFVDAQHPGRNLVCFALALVN